MGAAPTLWLLGGFALNVWMLLACRFLMGIGGALMWPAILGLTFSLLPASKAGLAGGLIMGAAGRDFHNFNTFFRGNRDYEVVAFTATQIPDIEGRLYPRELAGELYPSGVPIRADEELVDLIKQHGVEQVVFAYSDVANQTLMTVAQMVLAAGANFRLLGAHVELGTAAGGGEEDQLRDARLGQFEIGRRNRGARKMKLRLDGDRLDICVCE